MWICFLIVLTAALLCACGGKAEEKAGYADKKIEGSPLFVKKVENLPEDFIMGMDASSVIAEEQSGVKYYNFAGEEQDVFLTLAQSGITHIRVRVWNDPYDADGNGYGGGNCDIDRCVEIGRRASQYGLKLIVDFHYSDFWADPSKQMVPLAWKDMTIEEKTEAAYQYTKECLEKLRDAEVDVGVVQLGNETNGALAGEKIWFNIQYIMQAGAKATREVFPEAMVAVHFANPEKITNYAEYAKKLDYYSVDYDIFASSYYPFWHGTLDNLARVLSDVAETYGKKVMVMETSYAYTAEDSDFSGNTISDGGGIAKNYPFTVQGQANSVRDVIETVAEKTVNGIGVVYWEGAWISVGGESYEQNSELWEKYGSGWATSYAASYDPDDAGKYYGGCAVDNQAMFDPKGHPLESLRVFNLVRFGNETEVVPDAVEDVDLIADMNGAIELPETVNAVMTDDSKTAVPVVWDADAAEVNSMCGGKPGKYEITGRAGELEARCRISVVEYNFLENYSFESGELGPWRLLDYGSEDELYVEDKLSDSLTGQWHMHFWSAKQDSVDFAIEQTPEGLKTGSYKFTVSIMGGDCGKTEIFCYIKLNGEIVASAPMKITVYNEWDTVTVPAVEYAEGQVLTVGVSVKCQGEGNGAWGKIDDAMLNSVG